MATTDTTPHLADIRYNYRRSRFVKIVTGVAAVILAGIFVYLYLASSGTYLSAWFFSFAAAAIALFIMSMPRYILLRETEIEIHCVVELTTIPIRDIKRITRISRLRMKYALPVFGSYGFGGYFGYYVDLRKFTLLRMYATQWNRFVMIHDIFENRYVVSCTDAEQFIRQVMERRKSLPGEILPDINDSSAEEADTDD